MSVVIPAHCEEQQLPLVVAAVHEELEGTGESFEIVVVDDGSTDGTWAVLQSLCSDYPVLRGVRLSRNFGKEAALSAGLDEASGEAVIVMDADLQHPPSLIPEMLEAWADGEVDVVDAVKDARGDEPLTAALGARVFYALSSWLSGYDLRGSTDFKLLDRRVVETWRRLGERSLFFRGMVPWMGFTRVEIPFQVSGRTGGESSFSWLALLGLAATAVTAFSSFPLRVVTLGGLAFLVGAALLAVQTLVNWATGQDVSGFATVILLQLIIGSAVMIALGVIGEYVARIYEEVKARPRYIASDRCGASVSSDVPAPGPRS